MRPLRFQIYRRLTLFGHRWFWRCVSGNNQVIATGGEGFHNKNDVAEVIATLTAKIMAHEFLVEVV